MWDVVIINVDNHVWSRSGIERKRASLCSLFRLHAPPPRHQTPSLYVLSKPWLWPPPGSHSVQTLWEGSLQRKPNFFLLLRELSCWNRMVGAWDGERAEKACVGLRGSLVLSTRWGWRGFGLERHKEHFLVQLNSSEREFSELDFSLSKTYSIQTHDTLE